MTINTTTEAIRLLDQALGRLVEKDLKTRGRFHPRALEEKYDEKVRKVSHYIHPPKVGAVLDAANHLREDNFKDALKSLKSAANESEVREVKAWLEKQK